MERSAQQRTPHHPYRDKERYAGRGSRGGLYAGLNLVLFITIYGGIRGMSFLSIHPERRKVRSIPDRIRGVFHNLSFIRIQPRALLRGTDHCQ